MAGVESFEFSPVVLFLWSIVFCFRENNLIPFLLQRDFVRVSAKTEASMPLGYAVEVDEFKRRALFSPIAQRYGESALAVIGHLMDIVLPGA